MSKFNNTNKKDLRKGIDALTELYFSQPKVMYSHLFSSFHQFVEEMIPYSLEQDSNYFYENVTKDAIYLYGFKFSDTKILPPVRERDNEIVFPKMARKNFLNYFANINSKVTQFQERVDLVTGNRTRTNIGEQEEVIVASIPIMVKSKYCATNLKPETGKYECKYDPGGYFIVGGQEKIIVCIEKMIDNQILVFGKTDSSFNRGKMYTAQINSRKHDWSENLQIIAVRNNKDDSLVMTTSQLSEVPVLVILRALGIETDREIVARITNNLEDIQMINVLRNSLENCVDDEYNPIKTRDEAITYLLTKIKSGRRISQSDEEVANAQKKLLLEKIFSKDLLPHMGSDVSGKASFICLMIKKILNVMIGRDIEDDRDAFENKRVETPGVLLGQLFRQNFNKMLKEIGKLFRKKNNSDDNPINMVSQIKPTTIEQGIKSGLATGIWGLSKTKAGVAQSLSRLTWLQTISYLRRIKSPSMDTSTSKITSIRQINNVQAFFVCNVETPEGQPIGLAKSLSMMATISPRLESQAELINELILEHPKIKHPFIINPEDMDNMIKIFHNGVWKGVIEIKDGIVFYDNVKKMRKKGKINKFVTITMDYFKKDIMIYTEAGRLIRPLINVTDNEIKIDSEMFLDFKEHLKGKNKNTGWNKILLKYPDLVDYEDIESSKNLLIAMDLDMLLENKENSLRKVSNTEIIKPNRYGKFRYVNYTHSEFHPSMMLGTIVSTTPFVNHNPSPRAIIYFSQAKQAIGVYSTAYKDRMDISNILYHPQVPLVTTKASKYNRFLDLPSGENIIVAIMSYKGFNVEDSVMINQTSLDRGLFRADNLRKYNSKIEKNPSSSQDDIFMKPDRNKVTGMSRGNYEKLNDKGFIPEETKINNRDILIGKISPIQPTSDNKVFKDKSELYKNTVDGVVDRVHSNIFNSDGYEMISMRVRAERPPIIGDKFCLTPEHQVLTKNNKWKYINEINFKDQICILDPKTNTIKYEKPKEILCFNYDSDIDGKLYEIIGDKIHLITTPHHRMWVKDKKATKFNFKTAKECYKTKPFYKNHKELIDTNNCIENFIDYKGKVYCLCVSTQIFYTRLDGLEVWTGNSTRSGQKGTIGITLPQRDMPFTSEGMIPDLIFNPHGMPTRMTMGQLIETMGSKLAANIGSLFDGTPFSDYDVKEIPKMLKEIGMDEFGTEEMYCGMTGRKMEAKIFIGPVFYLRLKHMVKDKLHSRSTGPRQAVTRQPMEGRSKDGGLKIGEMEKDSMVAHGIGQFLKERMMETSDITKVMVCDLCGTFATKVMDKDYYVCNNCNNHTEFSDVALPYAFKLLIQELISVNIVPRIKAEKVDI